MAKVDLAMMNFPGFPGYQGDAPTNESEFEALFSETWANRPTWQEVQDEEVNLDKQDCKAKASALLSQTDWTQIADCPLKNKTEFATWRAQIRDFALNPVVDPVFPPKPNESW